jgi:hypothetical protein
MNTFDGDTIRTMRAVFDEVCGHVPRNSNSARTFIASRNLECASKGENSYEGLLAAGRRAVLDQFGNINALRTAMP